MKPRLLDLGCGAGGCSVGYFQAGFDIVGVDIEPQPNYPYRFEQGDMLTYPLEGFDVIHASPPCQLWTPGAKANGNSYHPDLVTPMRRRLGKQPLPWVMENVPAAPLVPSIMLCGSMFGLQVQRHRVFEIAGPLILQPSCRHIWHEGRPFTVTGHADGPKGYQRKKYLGFIDLAHARALIEMSWAGTTREVTEAIPPAYTRYIGEQLMAYLQAGQATE